MAKRAKKIFRKHLAHITKAGKVLIPVAAGVATYFGGPLAGEAVAYAGTRVQQKTAQASMRGKHMDRHDISQKSRKIANRTFKYSQLGVGLGGAASAVTAVAGGSSITGVLSQAALGQGGSALTSQGSTLFAAKPTAREFDTSMIDPETGLTYSKNITSGGIDYTSDEMTATKYSPGKVDAGAAHPGTSSGDSFLEKAGLAIFGGAASGAAKAVKSSTAGKQLQDSGFGGIFNTLSSELPQAAQDFARQAGLTQDGAPPSSGPGIGTYLLVAAAAWFGLKALKIA